MGKVKAKFYPCEYKEAIHVNHNGVYFFMKKREGIFCGTSNRILWTKFRQQNQKEPQLLNNKLQKKAEKIAGAITSAIKQKKEVKDAMKEFNEKEFEKARKKELMKNIAPKQPVKKAKELQRTVRNWPLRTKITLAENVRLLVKAS